MAFRDLAAMAPDETLEKLSNYYFAPYITHAHVFNAPKGWYMKNRTLKQYALQYVIDGKADFTVEDNTFTTIKGDLILYRPYEVHSVYMYPDCDYISITIVFHFANTSFPIDELFHGENYLGNYADHEVDKYISELVAKYQQPGLHNHFYCQGLLSLILSKTSEWHNKRQPPQIIQKRNLPRLVQVKNYIKANIDKNINPKQMEKISGLTWNYLISQFSKTFGYTPCQYLIYMRISKAKEVALQSSISIGEISNLVGYKDVHTFGKTFKKHTGMSLSNFCKSVYDEDNKRILSTNKADGLR